MHFRYRKRWVETLSLWDKLPLKVSKARILKSRKYSFLCISARNKQLEWQYVHPIRFGQLKNATEQARVMTLLISTLKLKSTVLIQI